MSKKSQKIIIGSKNPVKINAVKNAFSAMFQNVVFSCEGVSAPSGVADQPMTAEETLLGAENRVSYAKTHFQADWYVAIEGGVDNFNYGPATFAYIVIDNKQHVQVGRSSNLPMPKVVYQALCEGEELGHVMDRLFNTENVKQKGGAMALLTNNLVTRESVYTMAITTALAPFVNQQLFNV
ncbi:inosine/xanthosine triphosphatase [Pseudoalteromonas sp. SSM20]|uniref:inosine/xanthosine triphosphatase n=1 Tax=Pseudoalteromonas sp. SSM20 TaxID=3139394 RepID=UPI003BAB5F11